MSLSKWLLVAVVCLGWTSATGVTSAAPVIDWVPVGNPGNAADNTGYGEVSAPYEIMKYEWTNSLYAQFLNAVDPEGLNPNGIWNSSMGTDARGGISYMSGNAPSSKYAARTNMGDKPVNFVSWFDAARVANWLQAGAETYGTTTSGSAAINGGAYTLGGATTGTAPAKNANARYWLPSQNEWYKAAFYKGSGTNAGYWDFATQSDTAPTAVTATTVGTGTSGGASPVTTGNFANYNNDADWNLQNGNVTTVGSNGGPSAYGTFDMSGNVFEWNGLSAGGSSPHGIMGGGFRGTSADIDSSYSNTSLPTSIESDQIGFRLAAVPEPSTYAMALAGLACGGFFMRRKSDRDRLVGRLPHFISSSRRQSIWRSVHSS